ncbi:MAG: CoA pyrophosphatase [Microscillaceae bacterium]|nr:CoA pyrophosphatase [Microscillaceae bacterium]
MNEGISAPFLAQQLKEKLKEKLPGMDAHIHMAPPQRFVDKKRYEPNADTRSGGVLVLIYPQENTLFFPLILRPEDTGVHSGQIALPGGKKDPEDQDIVETALRETWEEIGVKIDRNKVIGQLSPLYIPPSNFLVYPTVAAIDYKPVFNPSLHEVAQLLEIDLSEFVSDDKRNIREISVRYMKAKVPCYDLAGHVVWGATAMILSEFLTILRSID